MIVSLARNSKPTFLASLALILALCLAPPAMPAHAAAPAKNAVLQSKTGSAYLPLRFLNGYAGGSAVFDEASKQITLTKDGVTISLTLGVKEASLGGVKTKLSQAPYREGGTVYVPLGIVIQAFSLKAEWDSTAGAVTLTDAQGIASRLPVQSGSLPSAGTQAVVTARKSVKAAGRSFQHSDGHSAAASSLRLAERRSRRRQCGPDGRAAEHREAQQRGSRY
ncbi:MULTISPECIES: copper amine oxidase N-terminal domain-containing protein [Paenibacillus]|uniref:copper amine oxidase N-terminal domain-containing protein n=1 Tax=Paenibacillus TaxID=44249 RepID=UPI001F39E018|nr:MULTISPECIES: copper amine oxidase N-terminal domain-containing protein [Paenibacillus]